MILSVSSFSSSAEFKYFDLIYISAYYFIFHNAILTCFCYFFNKDKI
jgi:hypothetical protein